MRNLSLQSLALYEALVNAQRLSAAFSDRQTRSHLNMDAVSEVIRDAVSVETL